MLRALRPSPRNDVASGHIIPPGDDGNIAGDEGGNVGKRKSGRRTLSSGGKFEPRRASSIVRWLTRRCIRTKHESRLARDFTRASSGTPAYATQEVVAELGSCYLAADLGPEMTPRSDHADYIANWLTTALKEDKRFIFTAASPASRVADCPRGMPPEP